LLGKASLTVPSLGALEGIAMLRQSFLDQVESLDIKRDCHVRENFPDQTESWGFDMECHVSVEAGGSFFPTKA